jgi:hypothetical protein
MVKCSTKSPTCGVCADISRTEQELADRLQKLDADREEWEAELHKRQVKAASKAKEADRKRRDFEAKKAAEIAVRRQEHEAWVCQREQKVLEDAGAGEIDAAMRACRDESERELARMERAHERTLANRIRQAQETVEQIQDAMRADEQKMQREREEQEASLQALVQESRDELARVTEEAAKDAVREREGLAQKRAAVERAKHQAIERVRDERSREQRQAEMAVHAMEQEAATLASSPAARATLAAARQVCSICMDDEVELVDGYLCDNHGDDAQQHFTCDTCFTGHVRSKMTEEVGLLERSDAQVYCPCKTPALGCARSSAVSEDDLFRCKFAWVCM